MTCSFSKTICAKNLMTVSLRNSSESLLQFTRSSELKGLSICSSCCRCLTNSNTCTSYSLRVASKRETISLRVESCRPFNSILLFKPCWKAETKSLERHGSIEVALFLSRSQSRGLISSPICLSELGVQRAIRPSFCCTSPVFSSNTLLRRICKTLK